MDSGVALLILLLIIAIPFLLGWYWKFSFFDCCALAAIFFLVLLFIIGLSGAQLTEGMLWLTLLLLLLLIIWAIRQLYLKYHNGGYNQSY